MYADKDTNTKTFNRRQNFITGQNVTTWTFKKNRGAMDRPLLRRRNIRHKLQEPN